jgi:hypothetical protein
MCRGEQTMRCERMTSVGDCGKALANFLGEGRTRVEEVRSPTLNPCGPLTPYLKVAFCSRVSISVPDFASTVRRFYIGKSKPHVVYGQERVGGAVMVYIYRSRRCSAGSTVLMPPQCYADK